MATPLPPFRVDEFHVLRHAFVGAGDLDVGSTSRFVPRRELSQSHALHRSSEIERGLSQRVADSGPPSGVYSVPEVAMVGITEDAAVGLELAYAIGRAPFAANTRAAISGAVEGMVKLVFERETLKLLGVHILGEGATELVHQGQAVIHFGGTIEYFINSTFNVPTMSEAYKYAAYDGLRQVGS